MDSGPPLRGVRNDSGEVLQLFGLDLVGNFLGPLLVLFDQTAGFVEYAGLGVQLADAGEAEIGGRRSEVGGAAFCIPISDF